MKENEFLTDLIFLILNKGIKEIRLTIRPSMKKNITSEEIKVNNFNKLVIASRNEFKDSELSSPKFSKNSISNSLCGYA